MRKAEVRVGGKYLAKVSGKIVTVQLQGEKAWGSGWDAINLTTGRPVHIKSAARLRSEVTDV